MSQIVTRGKKFEALQKRLKAANKRFAKLSKSEQRVRIAKDVIAQLKTKEIVPRSQYFGVSDYAAYEEAKKADLDMSECVSQVSCQVCGIGSLFVAAVKRADDLKISDFLGDDRALEVEYLKDWFNEEQLHLVEEYYERHDHWSPVEGESWVVMHPDHPITREMNPGKRMKMIMENVVSNSGRFIPTRGAHGAKP